MALFEKSRETKEEKQERKEREILEKYGLQALTDPADRASVKKIVSEMAGSSLMEAGIALGGGSERDIARVSMAYQRTIVEQNFVLIRQLDRIARLLEK